MCLEAKYDEFLVNVQWGPLDSDGCPTTSTGSRHKIVFRKKKLISAVDHLLEHLTETLILLLNPSINQFLVEQH